MPSYEDIVDLCVSYEGPCYFVLDLIPARKLANARAHYPILNDEPIIALIDTTGFGSAKTGVAVCQSGVYWRNQAGYRKYNYMAWEEVNRASIKPKGVLPPRLVMGPDIMIELASGGINKEQVANLFADISSLCTFNTNVYNERWMLATGGQQLGPYNKYDLQARANANMFDLNTSFVWREGMKEWMPIAQVPELSDVFGGTHTLGRNNPPPLPNLANALNNLPSTSSKEQTTNVEQGVTQKSQQPLTDLNNADLEEMLSLPLMHLGNAERVAAARRQRGGFRELEEIGQLLQFKPHEVERLREMTLVGPRPQGAASGRLVDF